MKVLVVDDNKVRNKEIKNLLIENCKIQKNNIVLCLNAQDAKNHMRNTYFDIVILDVMLPQRDESPSAAVGIKLLEEVSRRPVLKTPGRVLGITANFDDINQYQSEFEKYFFTVIEATLTNKKWKGIIVDTIKYNMSSSISKSTNTQEKICLTLHGIKTRGAWQQKLHSLINNYTDTIDVQHYKYGYFSVFSFFIPYLRQQAVKNFSLALNNLIQNNPNKSFIVFAHSFGTYIAVKGIEKLIKSGVSVNLNKLVLCGSVLNSNHDFSVISENCKTTIINEAGDSDLALIASQAFIPNTGMAGRTGFHGFNNKRFVNRYFNGGHSLYFNEDSDFIERYWLPLLSTEEAPLLLDQRTDSFAKNVLEITVRFIGKFKELIYIGLALYIVQIFVIPW